MIGADYTMLDIDLPESMTIDYDPDTEMFEVKYLDCSVWLDVRSVGSERQVTVCRMRYHDIDSPRECLQYLKKVIENDYDLVYLHAESTFEKSILYKLDIEELDPGEIVSDMGSNR